MFFKPLTLIVGVNGAGKTTIIESLKYATCGEFPPNAQKGQHFVHDPRVAGERQVKAQVKLKFTGANGKPIVVTRHLLLAQKGTKQSCKALESSLQTFNEQNQVVSQSYRCADLDKLIPELMGVSKAILQYVVFCHQEESNWPLDEGAKLRSRFDEIFAATKYTQALDKIKKFRKEQAQGIREMKLKLDTYVVQKDHAAEWRKKLQAAQRAVQSIDEEVAEANTIAERKREAIDEIDGQLAAVQALTQELQTSLARLSEARATVSQLEEQLPEQFIEGDDDLAKLRTKCVSKIDKHQNLITTARATHAQALRARDQAQADLNQANVTLGRLEGAQRAIAKAHQQRKDAMAELHSLVKDHVPCDPEDFGLVCDVGQSMCSELKTRLESMQAEHTKDESVIAAEISHLQGSLARLEQDLRAAAQAEANLSGREAKAQQELSRAEAAQRQLHLEGNVEGIRDAARAKREEEQRAKDEATSGGAMASVAAKQRERDEAEARVSKVGDELRALNVHASTRAALDLARTQATEAAERMALVDVSRMVQVLGEELAPEALGDALRSRLRSQQSALNEAMATEQSVGQALSALNARCDAAKARVKRAKDALAVERAPLTEFFNKAEMGDSSELEILMQNLQSKVRRVAVDISKTEASLDLYKSFREQVAEHQSCPLCTRPFEVASVCEELLNYIDNLLLEFPKSLDKRKRKLVEVESLHEQLTKLKPHFTAARQLETVELPEAETAVRELQDQMDSVSREAEEAGRAATELKESVQEVTELVEAGAQLHADARTLAEAKVRVATLEQELQQVSGDARTTEEVSAEYDAARRRVAALSTELDVLRRRAASAQSVVHELGLAAEQLEREAERATSAARDAQRARDLLDEIAVERVALLERTGDGAGGSAAERRAAIGKKKHDADIRLRDMRARHRDEQGKLRAQVDRLQRACFAADAAAASAVSGEAGAAGGVSQLEAAQRAQAAAQEAVTTAAKEAADAAQALDASQKHVQKLQHTLGMADQNMKLRAEQKRVEKLEEEIANIEARIEREAPGASTSAPRKQALEREERAALETRARAEGRREEMVAVRRNAKQELAKPEYRSIDETHRRHQILLKTTEMAANDLDTYARALDKALMRYHTTKMNDINRILKQLWRDTYRGNDIDYIEIRSDLEEGATRRNYNYRIVMKKHGIELDMRGRCSAGQRVLACILVRLALAEAFCLQMGVIALDEPTTNLDARNIESLADALKRIIQSRAQQRNFQLVLITHDEHFVSLLGRSSVCDYYYRVLKDGEAATRVERRDISEMG